MVGQTFWIFVSIQKIGKIELFKISINLSVVFVINVTTIRDQRIAITWTKRREICTAASTRISASFRIPSRQRRRKLRNLSKLDCGKVGAFSSEWVVRNIG